MNVCDALVMKPRRRGGYARLVSQDKVERWYKARNRHGRIDEQGEELSPEHHARAHHLHQFEPTCHLWQPFPLSHGFCSKASQLKTSATSETRDHRRSQTESNSILLDETPLEHDNCTRTQCVQAFAGRRHLACESVNSPHEYSST